MTKRRRFLQQSAGVVGLAATLSVWGCKRSLTTSAELSAAMTMQLESDAFTDQSSIPAKYTCDGENISPALTWDAPPSDAQSLALIVDDPDAPGQTFSHWVVYDLPVELRQLSEGLPPQPILLEGGVQGKNDFGRYGYGGPCPPSGTHRYFFQLFALDTLLNLPPGATKEEAIAAMKNHVLAGAELVGRYSR